MAQVRIDPKSKNWPYLEAGKYGPGQQYEAECELMSFECPSSEMPAYDQDGEDGPYAYFEVQVRRDDQRPQTIRHWEPLKANTGSRALPWVENILGADAVSPEGDFDDTSLPGAKLIVECSEPSPAKGNPDKKYTRVKTLFAAS